MRALARLALRAAVSCGALVTPCGAQVAEEDVLIRLNRDLLESVFLRQDSTLLGQAALPGLLVVPPGGIVENRAQVFSGLSLTAMDSVRVDDVVVSRHENTAVVISRVTRLGALPASAGTGRIRIMSVFVYTDGRWRFLARSVTPCIERALTVGRC
jgi:hypothetical protein